MFACTTLPVVVPAELPTMRMPFPPLSAITFPAPGAPIWTPVTSRTSIPSSKFESPEVPARSVPMWLPSTSVPSGPSILTVALATGTPAIRLQSPAHGPPGSVPTRRQSRCP